MNIRLRMNSFAQIRDARWPSFSKSDRLLGEQWHEVQPGEGYDTPKFRAIIAQLASQHPGSAHNVPRSGAPTAKMSDTPPAIPLEGSQQPRTPYIIGAFFLVAGVVALLWRAARKRQVTKSNEGKVGD
jgi:hypothetical protein